MDAGVSVAASNSYAECSKCAIAYAPWHGMMCKTQDGSIMIGYLVFKTWLRALKSLQSF